MTTLKNTVLTLGVLAGVASAGAAHAAVYSVAAEDQPYCREFQQTMTIAGKTQKGYGTACLQPDGSWEIQKTDTGASAPTTMVEEKPTIQYVVQKERVYLVPPEPFVFGTVLIGGHPRRFDEGFRPRWQPDMHHGGHDGPGHGGWRH